MLIFYILFLISSFLIHPHKLFSMQLGPGTASLACARLIVSFAPFNVYPDSLHISLKEHIALYLVRYCFPYIFCSIYISNQKQVF